ncbi:MAG: leucine-rich repeat domain-containing protein [Candidatus Kapaibacterium sp.]
MIFLFLLLFGITETLAQATGPRPVGVDSVRSDTSSFRSRRLRGPRPPRPGIFTSLDSARSMPDSVVVLNLRGKGLTTITGLGAFKNLTVLDLADNALGAFPAEALKLSKLVALDLSNNPIKYVPPEIGSLTGLVRLNLRNTGIASVPSTIAKCTMLTGLDVSKNPLTSLPIKELNMLPRLKTITLGGMADNDGEGAPPPPSETRPEQPGEGGR